MEAGGSQPIFLFLPDFAGGGAERVVLEIAGGLARARLRPILVVGIDKGPLASHSPPGVPVLSLGTRYPWAMAWRFGRLLREQRPRAVLAALPPANVAAGLGKLLAHSQVRLVLTEHNRRSMTYRRLWMPGTWLRRWSYRAAARAADVVVAVSGGVAQDMESYFGIPRERIRVVHNPVVGEEMLAAGRSRPAHPWFSTSRDAPVVLGAGRLTSQKDFPTLLRAITLLNRSETVRLIVLGDGEERAALLRLRDELDVTDIVQFPGWVDNPYPYMAHADVFVLSSAWEGFGNVLVEAMAFGTAVVSTDCESGPSDILEGGRLGPLVPVGDPEALASAIRRVLQEPVPPDLLRGAARRYSRDRILPRYIELLTGR